MAFAGRTRCAPPKLCSCPRQFPEVMSSIGGTPRCVRTTFQTTCCGCRMPARTMFRSATPACSTSRAPSSTRISSRGAEDAYYPPDISVALTASVYEHCARIAGPQPRTGAMDCRWWHWRLERRHESARGAKPSGWCGSCAVSSRTLPRRLKSEATQHAPPGAVHVSTGSPRCTATVGTHDCSRMHTAGIRRQRRVPH
jgi:hypothetical protein